jgi:hypothetical protein
MDKKRYPTDWDAISKRIRFDRAQGKCERCGAEHGQPHPRTGSIVVLTTAHIGAPHADGTPGDKHDKMDVRDENLLALCQGCHLREDIADHVLNAAWTRRRKQVEAGQIELFRKEPAQ